MTLQRHKMFLSLRLIQRRRSRESRSMFRPLIVFLLVALTAGCAGPVQRLVGEAAGESDRPLPVTVGPAQDNLKRSPCACIEIQLLPPPGVVAI